MLAASAWIPSEASEVGTVVGPYRVLRPIASGGMGRVYLARHSDLGRLAALKFLARPLATSATQRAQFLEARATAALSHPNVVTVYDVGEHDGRPFVALEYVHGKTLHHLLRSDPPSPRVAVKIAAEIASGVAAAHSVGLLHRDLKPGNVVIGSDGRVRVLDFGIARMVEDRGPVEPDDLTRFDLQPAMPARTGRAGIAGTPAYMAPEQWEGRDTQATDAWGVGLLLYEMLAGKNPLVGLEPASLLAHLDSAEPFPPLTGALPHELVSLVERCLDRTPEQRPSAAELAAQLTELAPSLDDSPPPSESVRGLAPYGPRDAESFKGRDSDVKSVLATLETTPVVRVAGPPGSGKTSLMRAGVAPALESTGRWQVLFVEPGPSPFASAARAIAGASENATTPIAASDLESRLRASPGALGLALGRLAVSLRKRVLFVVDPIDERAIDRGEPGDFAKAVASAAGDPSEPVRVVVVSRDDTPTKRALDAMLATVATAEHRLRPLGREELHEALTRTLNRAGAQFDDATVVDELLNDAGDKPSAPALVSLTVQRLWERGRGAGALRRADYEELGGTGGIIAAHAEHVVSRWSESDQALVRTLLLRLVDLSGAPRAMPSERLVSGLGPAAPAALERLLSERVLTWHSEDEALVELAHPALTQRWLRLARWILDTRGGGNDDLRSTFVAAADRWVRTGRTEAQLLTNAELAELDRAGEATETWPEHARAFVIESRRALAKRDRDRRVVLAVVLALSIVSLAFAAGLLTAH